MGDKVSGGTVTEKPQLLDWLAEQAKSADLSGLGDTKVDWYFRGVHPDLRSRDGFRYPWPGRWAEAPGPLLEHKGACPKSPGDGLCVAKDFNGAGSGGIRLGTLLLVGVNADDVLGQDDHKLRVKRMYVADLIDIRTVLRDADLGGAYLRGAYLGGADLGGADLGGAYLGSADLRSADLRSADLRSAYLGGAYLRGADLGGADLRDAYLGGAYLGGAYLRDAYLRDADLRGAYLRDADLGGADLGGADLRGADLRGADLRSADLGGAYLGGAYLRGAVHSQLTLWPAGFDPVAAGAVKL